MATQGLAQECQNKEAEGRLKLSVLDAQLDAVYGATAQRRYAPLQPPTAPGAVGWLTTRENSEPGVLAREASSGHAQPRLFFLALCALSYLAARFAPQLWLPPSTRGTLTSSSRAVALSEPGQRWTLEEATAHSQQCNRSYISGLAIEGDAAGASCPDMAWSLEFGYRTSFNGPFTAPNCALRWFSPEEACRIVQRRGFVLTVGDSLLRQLDSALHMVLIGNYSFTAPEGSPEGLTCACERQFDPPCPYRHTVGYTEALPFSHIILNDWEPNASWCPSWGHERVQHITSLDPELVLPDLGSVTPLSLPPISPKALTWPPSPPPPLTQHTTQHTHTHTLFFPPAEPCLMQTWGTALPSSM